MASSQDQNQTHSKKLTTNEVILAISKLHVDLSELKSVFDNQSIETDQTDSIIMSKGSLDSGLPAKASRISINRSNTEDNINNRYSAPNGNQDISFSLEKLCNDLNYIGTAFNKMKNHRDDLAGSVQILETKLNDMISNVQNTTMESLDVEKLQSKLFKISKDILNLKYTISFPNKSSKIFDTTRHSHIGNKINNGGGNKEFRSIHMSIQLSNSLVFKEVEEIYKKLHIQRKLCLLSFAVFPENAIVKKRLLLYWWIGERFIGYLDPKESVEATLEEILDEFKREGLIKPVDSKHTSTVSCYSMPPLIRAIIIKLAKDAGFCGFDENGNPTMETQYKWACLGQLQADRAVSNVSNVSNLKELQTLFNVSERFPDYTFKWFSDMKELKVLYLGRWERTAERHIEVETTEFLKKMKYMKKLRFLSFQGISRIEELPSSVCKLTDLVILDLKACYNLEKLPNEIYLLENLTHLDISECYLLDRMPRKLYMLSKLQVLRGFVISDAAKSCTLEKLSELKDLRKLSININKPGFGSTDLIAALQKLKSLQKLKVSWGGVSSAAAKPDSTVEPTNVGDENKAAQPKTLSKTKTFVRAVTFQSREEEAPVHNVSLPSNIKKLDLQCFPEPDAPVWLMPENLHSLEKLYIKGGNLKRLSEPSKGKDKCSIEVLRLKHLNELRMNWRQLKALFPKLIYLEKFRCPRISLCPCDDTGVWKKN